MTAPEQQMRKVTVPVIGNPEHVANVLATQQRRGTLVSAEPARRIGRNTVRVDMVVLQASRGQARPTPRPAESDAEPRKSGHPYALPAAAVAVALAALAAVGALIAALIEWVLSNWITIVGFALLAAACALVLAMRLAGRGDGRGVRS